MAGLAVLGLGLPSLLFFLWAPRTILDQTGVTVVSRLRCYQIRWDEIDAAVVTGSCLKLLGKEKHLCLPTFISTGHRDDAMEYLHRQLLARAVFIRQEYGGGQSGPRGGEGTRVRRADVFTRGSRWPRWA